MYGEPEISKALSCSCGVINKIGINTDYNLNHISLDVTCKNCGKEVKIELGTLPGNGNSQVRANIAPEEPTQEAYNELPNVSGYYDGEENTQQEENTLSDPLADMMGSASIEIPGIEKGEQKEIENNEVNEDESDENKTSEEGDSRNIDEIIDEEDAIQDESEGEEITEEEKEAFSDLFGKL